MFEPQQPGTREPDGPAKRPGPFVPVLLAWLIPGAGHLRLGRTWPGVFIALAVIPLFVLGMALAGWENVSPQRHAWYFALHVWCAVPAAVAALLTSGRELLEEAPYASVGVLYSAVAGLLNLVAIADCWARCKRGDPEALGNREAAGHGKEGKMVPIVGGDLVTSGEASDA